MPLLHISAAGLPGAGLCRRSGQAAILAALSLTLLFGTLGLAVDLGWSYYLKQRLQTVADAAAGAAARYALDNQDKCGGNVTCPATLTCSGMSTPSNSLQAGCDYGLADAPSGTTVSMLENTGGLSGNKASIWIQATATTSSPNVFLFLSGFKTASISAQSTGGVTSFSGAGCIYALDKTAAKALQVTGASSASATNCGVYVASSASNALYVSGSSTVTGSRIVLNCLTCYTTGGTSTISPTPPVVATVTDPLKSSLSPPSYSGCTKTNYSLGSSNTDNIRPGVYCGGISVTGAAQLTLQSGVYVLNGGGLTMANSATLNATSGVMFYNTSSGTGYPAGSISITGAAVANLTALSSGPYEGIAFYQDPALTNAATIANSASGNITGTYYFPSAAFSLTGATATATTAAFIADTITITGSSSLNNDPTGKVTGLNKSYAGVFQ